MIKFSLSLATAVFFVAAHPALAHSDRDERAVKSVANQFVSAWNVHEAARIGELFASDADFVNYVGIWWKNKAAIVAGHDHVLKTFLKDSHLQVTDTAVRFLDGGSAVLRFQWELSGQTNPATGEEVATRTGLVMCVLVKKARAWKIVAAQNTDILPKAQILAPDGSRTK